MINNNNNNNNKKTKKHIPSKNVNISFAHVITSKCSRYSIRFVYRPTLLLEYQKKNTLSITLLKKKFSLFERDRLWVSYKYHFSKCWRVAASHKQTRREKKIRTISNLVLCLFIKATNNFDCTHGPCKCTYETFSLSPSLFWSVCVYVPHVCTS